MNEGERLDNVNQNLIGYIFAYHVFFHLSCNSFWIINLYLGSIGKGTILQRNYRKND